jgi:O-antigen ligase
VKDDPAPPAPAGSKVALAVLVALVVLSPWPFGSVHLRTTQAIALVSLVTALGAFLWDGWHGTLRLPPRALLWPLLGLWALAVFQLVPLPEALHRAIAPGSAAVWHPDVRAAAAVLGPGPHPISLYPEATRRWLAFATGLVALALAAAPALRHRRQLLRASVVIVAGATAVAVYGFVARLMFGDRLFGVWTVPTVAPFGPFVSKNHFAGYVELAALLAVGLATGLTDEANPGKGWLGWIESRRAKWVVVAWGAALVLVLAIPVSLSRGGVVSLTAGLLAFALLRLWARRESRLTARGVAGLLAGLAVTAGLLLTVLPSESRDRMLSLAGITTEQSGAYRLALWRDTLRLAASSPWVGSGFGAYEDALPRFKTAAGGFRVQHAENDHLEFLAEGGALGALLGGVGVLALLLAAIGRLGSEEGRMARATCTAAAAGVVALYVHSAFDFNLHIPSNALMATLIALFAFGTVRLPGPSDLAGVARATTGRGAMFVAVSLLVALLTPWSEPRREPAALARAGTPSRTDLRRSSLESDLTALLRQRPGQATAWVQLAWLRLPGNREEARALAEWGLSLDPQHRELARVSASLRDAGR